MAGQLTALGAQELANHIGGIVPPYIGTVAPTWVPGLLWINTTAGAVLNYWNGSAWVAGTEPLYVALLTGDPSTSGPNGDYARQISDLIEDITAGYARQAVTFAAPAAYSGVATYTLGELVSYTGYVYSCAVASVSGTAPSGTDTSSTDWAYISPDYPAKVANTAALTFGYTANQNYPVQWAALVTVASGTTGLLKYLWAMPSPEKVAASQSIQIGAGLAAVTVS